MVQGKAPDPHLDTLALLMVGGGVSGEEGGQEEEGAHLDTLALLMAAAMAGKSCRDLEEDYGEGGGRGVRGGAEG